MSATVALAPCDNYDPNQVLRALGHAFDLAGRIHAFAAEGSRILLKPNVLMPFPPDRAVCVHPEVLRATIRLFRDAGCHVLVGEQPGMGRPEMAVEAMEVSGIAAVCREEGVECRLFDH